MKRIRGTMFSWTVAATLVGCAGTGDVQYGGEVQVSSPDLVAVDPGVQVVADADQPLFFSDGYYWLYSGGAWLRSDNYRGGFARVDINMVPAPVRGIRSPTAYVHYRQHNNVAQRPEARPQPRAENRVRDQPARPTEPAVTPRGEPEREAPKVVEPRPEARSTEPVEGDANHTVRQTEPTPTSQAQKTPMANPTAKPSQPAARERGAEHERPDRDDR
jgi:hypothetical protein